MTEFEDANCPFFYETSSSNVLLCIGQPNTAKNAGHVHKFLTQCSNNVQFVEEYLFVSNDSEPTLAAIEKIKN